MGEGAPTVETGDVLARDPAFRRTLEARNGTKERGRVTLFKSLGLAVEDLAAALVVMRRARAEGGDGCASVHLNSA